MQLLVRIGEALVSDAPEPALTAVIRAARQARNRVAVAIAREERALLRIRTRRSAAALRDLLFAAARYRDVQDRLRVLHRAAELLSARGDLLAAREVLLARVIWPARRSAHTRCSVCARLREPSATTWNCGAHEGRAIRAS
jgi:hypothetical protein